MTNSDYYRERIQDSLEFIDQYLCENLTAADVARAASFSEYHFHRLFPAFIGESIHQYVRRCRLEKAARLLVENRSVRLLDLALEVGFETHSAFSRAFKQEFGVSPSKFTKSKLAERPHPNQPNLNATKDNTISLTPSVQSLPRLNFSYKVAKGTSAGQFFSEGWPDEELADLVQQSGKNLLGVVSAFPVSPQSLNDLSVEVWYGGLFSNAVVDPRGYCSVQLEAGQWAVFEHKGNYKYLHQVWNQIYRAWLPNCAYLLRDTLPFEMYLNSPKEVAPTELLTQIWLPIRNFTK